MNSAHSPVSRRDFLKRTAGAAVIGAALPAALSAKAAKAPLWTPKMATQLYVFRTELPTSMTEANRIFEELARMGYQGLEFENWHNVAPSEWAKLLRDNGLEAAGNHLTLNVLAPDRLQQTVDENAAIGNKFLIVRSLGRGTFDTRDNFMRTLDTFNQVAESLEPYGMRVGFHNHAEMFTLMDGEWLWNIMADNTRADVVLQLDTGNAQGRNGGVDMVQVLRRNPGRVDTMHVKPWHAETRGAFIGDDQLPWAEIVEASKDSTEWYIIEYEVPGTPPLVALKANLDNFRRFYTPA